VRRVAKSAGVETTEGGHFSFVPVRKSSSLPAVEPRLVPMEASSGPTDAPQGIKRAAENEIKQKSPKRRRVGPAKEHSRRSYPFDEKDWDQFKDAEW